MKIFISDRNPLSEKKQLCAEDCHGLRLAQYLDNNDCVSSQLQPYFSADMRLQTSNRENMLQLIAQDKAVSYFPYKISAVSPYVADGLITPMSIEGLQMPTTHFMARPIEKKVGYVEQEIARKIQESYLFLN